MAEKLEDLNLPNASVAKIIKEAIPDSVNIGKEARTALARAAAVFVLYISSHASQEAQKSNRKTMVAQDVLDSLTNLEFEEFIEPLKESLKGKLSGYETFTCVCNFVCIKYTKSQINKRRTRGKRKVMKTRKMRKKTMKKWKKRNECDVFKLLML